MVSRGGGGNGNSQRKGAKSAKGGKGTAGADTDEPDGRPGSGVREAGSWGGGRGGPGFSDREGRITPLPCAGWAVIVYFFASGTKGGGAQGKGVMRGKPRLMARPAALCRGRAVGRGFPLARRSASWEGRMNRLHLTHQGGDSISLLWQRGNEVPRVAQALPFAGSSHG